MSCPMVFSGIQKCNIIFTLKMLHHLVKIYRLRNSAPKCIFISYNNIESPKR